MKATDMLHILKVQNKRLFIIWLVTFIAFIGMLGYTIWLLNDIGTIDEITKTQEIQGIDTIENSNIANGDMYGDNKTNDKKN